MLENLKFYKQHYPEVERMVRKEELIDLAQSDLNLKLTSAVNDYENKNYGPCTTKFEEVLALYFDSVRNCQKACQIVRKYPKDFASFWVSVGKIHADFIECQQACFENVEAIG